jgi:hypothetical protein
VITLVLHLSRWTLTFVLTFVQDRTLTFVQDLDLCTDLCTGQYKGQFGAKYNFNRTDPNCWIHELNVVINVAECIVDNILVLLR